MSVKTRITKVALDIMIVLLIIIAIVCGNISYTHFAELKREDKEFEKLSYKSYTKLKSQNPDMWGWLKIKKSKINYPVMYTPKDPEYYLHRNFKKEYSASGTLFISGYSDPAVSHNILIYGHHMMDGSMFGNLSKYISEEKDTIYFDVLQNDDGSLYERRKYKVIAAFKTSADTADPYYYYDEIEDQETFEKYVDLVRKNNELSNSFTCEWPSNLITLSTCSYHIWHNGKLDHSGRYVVIAKQISSSMRHAK